jgi:predicted ArsR family transcriptional regulator
MTTAELAVVIGVHRTSVAQHLRSLADDGLVQTLPLAPVGRGRPSTAYVAIDPEPYRTARPSGLERWKSSRRRAGGRTRADLAR